LPGTGKSSLAEAVGLQLTIPVFAKDWLEATLVSSGLVSNNRDKRLGFAGYELLTLLATRQLQMGQSVILDCVASTISIRRMWKNLAFDYCAKLFIIECVCQDEILHRERLYKRQRGIPGWYEIEWADIERIRTYFEPWDEPRLVLDAVHPYEVNLNRALVYCS
jgi:predicted kinase